jgi:hypothetical protein
MSAERRIAPRYQFIAYAEVMEIASGAKVKVQTGDLSIGGCFLDMMNPLHQGAEVEVSIVHGQRKFTALGRIVFVFPRLGMGVAFTQIRPEQLQVLHDWLANLERVLCRDNRLSLRAHGGSAA